jgi:Glycosyltransferase family 87
VGGALSRRYGVKETFLRKGAGGTLRLVLGAGIALWNWLERIPALVQDALLYVVAAGFAFLTSAFAVSSDYRSWGWFAGIVYVVAACAALISERVIGRSQLDGASLASRIFGARKVIVALVVCGAVFAPLAAEVGWRAEGAHGAHAQPEVPVIERAGDRVAAGHSPYLANPTQVGNDASSDSRNIDAESYFPYLPGMAVFGLTNALALPVALTDARLVIVAFTIAVAALALRLAGSSNGRRLRVLQFLVALPLGALPLVTGGDDLPVIALVLLGLVLAARRSPILAGLTLGCAATLKFTAWPILLLMALASRDRAGRPAPGRYLIAATLVVVPVTVIGFIPSPRAFVESVIKFPLGLTGVRSPAASPLLGQWITHLLPSERKPITVALLAVGLVIVIVVGKLRTPRTTAQVAGFTAFALLLATVLAPATRFGYLIYPADLAVFAYLVAGMRPGALTTVPAASAVSSAQSASSSSTSWSSTLEATVASPPPSAGETDGLLDSTVTSSSQ